MRGRRVLRPLDHRAVRPEVAAQNDEAALRAWHTKYFGPQGEVHLAIKNIGKLPAAERRAYGQSIETGSIPSSAGSSKPKIWA